MSTLNDILRAISELSASDKQKLKSILAGTDFIKSANIKNLFTISKACPICGSTHIVRNGHRADGTQRFVCRDCRKSFIASSNSIVARTRKDINVWGKYISCMMYGMSIRKTAEICGINKNTAFYWRHKILDALTSRLAKIQLNGIVEADETFFAVSYKGNHKNSKTFIMPREAHKRGGETRKRGLSREQVCVSCAVNRTGQSIAKVATLGRITSNTLSAAFDGIIDESSILVTDKASAYISFADKQNIELVQLKGGRSQSGIYHIQHINSYHSTLKGFMRGFRGVSTKYLNNYLAWNNFVKYSKEPMTEKQRILFNEVLMTTPGKTCKQVCDRVAIPVAV